MNNQLKTKCSFCRYWTGQGCMVTPNSHYCREATDEYYQYLKNKKTGATQAPVKSLRKWGRK